MNPVNLTKPSWIFEWDQLQEACRAENFCIELFLDDQSFSMFTGCELDNCCTPPTGRRRGNSEVRPHPSNQTAEKEDVRWSQKMGQGAKVYSTG